MSESHGYDLEPEEVDEEAEKAEGLRESYLSVFRDNPHVRAVIEDLAFHGYQSRVTLEAPAIGAPCDPVRQAFNEGKRSLWLHINSYLRMSDDELITMSREKAQSG